jgi:hypothetical protein
VWLSLSSLDGERDSVNTVKIAGFIAMGAVLIVSGLFYFRRSQEIADMIAGQLGARPWQRLWLPARWYSSRKFFWRLRISAVGIVIIGALLIVSAFGALIHHQ